MAGGGTRSFDAVDPARTGKAFAAWLLPFILIVLAAAMSHRYARPYADLRKAPEPSLLHAVSRRPALAFGFRNFLADVAWLEAIQVSGSMKLRPEDYDRLVLLLETVFGFDPRFLVPYLFGGIILGESADHGQAALSFLARGEKEYPLEWRLPFYAGYTYYFTLGNAADGGDAILRAARIPGSPAYFPLLASRMLSEGNRPETALSFLRYLVAHEKDPRRLQALEARILQVMVERDLQLLEKAVSEYKATRGTLPGNLSDLVASELIAQVPKEPNGGRYLITPQGEVRSDRAPSGRLRVFRKR